MRSEVSQQSSGNDDKLSLDVSSELRVMSRYLRLVLMYLVPALREHPIHLSQPGKWPDLEGEVSNIGTLVPVT